MPFVGTDLGDAFDESLVLAPGMVLVLEPVIWEDGHAGHRSEEIVAVTDDGYACLVVARRTRRGRRMTPDTPDARLGIVCNVMAAHDVDVMLLGREANARVVAGTTRLWLAGTRAFAPGCVVVREPPAVHVLANSDDSVPAGFPVEHLFGITWNPEKMLGALLAIPGLAAARRVAVDGMTPMMHALLSSGMPEAQLVDAAPVLTELRARPDTERLVGVRAAAEVGVAGLAAMVAELRPGVRPRTLRGACAEAFASFGVTTPAFEAVASPLEAGALDVAAARPPHPGAPTRGVARRGAARRVGGVGRTHLHGSSLLAHGAAATGAVGRAGRGVHRGCEGRRAPRARCHPLRGGPRRRTVGRRLRAARRARPARSRSRARSRCARTCSSSRPTASNRSPDVGHSKPGCQA